MTVLRSGVPSGTGLGLRRSLLPDLLESKSVVADFLELAPENWIGVGGRLGRRLRALSERYPLVCHGLSLNLGGSAPLSERLLADVRRFLDEHNVAAYSEHLSACGDHAQLYDLLPVPFTDENVRRIAGRIQQVQDALQRPLIIENVSAYLTLPGQMSEAAFVRAVLEEADCQLLLDVNNAYVNSVNLGGDPFEFIQAMPSERVAYLHMAGHFDAEPGLKIDSHGAAVADPVWQLLEQTYGLHGVRPTLLERDFNIPALSGLMPELQRIRALQAGRAAA
ncbi:MAG: DUF692 domain-containing protein [Pseudomonadaceae bacterium]